MEKSMKRGARRDLDWKRWIERGEWRYIDGERWIERCR
jgi:hypothetical protein